MQQLVVIQWLWETRRRAPVHDPIAGSKMALTAAVQTVQRQDSLLHAHEAPFLNEVGARLTCKGAKMFLCRSHEIRGLHQPDNCKKRPIHKCS